MLDNKYMSDLKQLPLISIQFCEKGSLAIDCDKGH